MLVFVLIGFVVMKSLAHLGTSIKRGSLVEHAGSIIVAGRHSPLARLEIRGGGLHVFFKIKEERY